MTALAKAPVVTLEAADTLMENDTFAIYVQKLLMDDQWAPGMVSLHQNTGKVSYSFIDVPATHLLALDLDDATITKMVKLREDHRYAIVFKHYQHALDYLTKHYGLAQAPAVTLEAAETLVDTDAHDDPGTVYPDQPPVLTLETSCTLLDDGNTLDNVTLNQNILPLGGFCFIDVPATHLHALDLYDSTITRFSVRDNGHRYTIVFQHYQHALDYLAKHYGFPQAPIVTLEAANTLVDTDTFTINVQELLIYGQRAPGMVLLHQHTGEGSYSFIDVPASHLHALDLDDSTISQMIKIDTEFGHRYSIVFNNHQHALDYLTKHYGLAQANDRAPAPADSTPCPSAIVVPAHLSTPPRLTRRPLSTTAFSPFGVIHMSKKQPVRVFLDQEIHSRYLIQAGTHGLTPSALGEKLLHHGLAQLERGDTSALAAVGAASPAPHGNEA